MKGPISEDRRLVLFENRWLEKLTVIPVRWFIAIWALLLPAIAIAAWDTAPIFAAIGLVFAGWLGWSLFEYSAHRWLFHCAPRAQAARRLIFVIHGNHHEEPNDKLRNLMPPVVSVAVGLLIWVLLYAVVGVSSAWMMLGFMSGYVLYDLTHYACHHYPMRGRIGRVIKRHHMRHHFISGGGNYAVTAIFWDWIFDTRLAAGARRETRKSAQYEEVHPAE